MTRPRGRRRIPSPRPVRAPPVRPAATELPDQARVVTLAGCGHSPMWDDPALVAATILGEAP
jgi:pimeloyl-ACP methyl ester carboxylesterase